MGWKAFKTIAKDLESIKKALTKYQKQLKNINKNNKILSFIKIHRFSVIKSS